MIAGTKLVVPRLPFPHGDFPSQVKNFKILVAEADPNYVLLLQGAFAQVNLANNVQVVRDGEEAVAFLQNAARHRERRSLPSLILMNLKLPRKSGLEVLEWMRSQPRLKLIPVIVMSSSVDPSDAMKAYRGGANSFLVKPVDCDGQLDMVRSIEAYWVRLNQGPFRVGFR
jgi:CheY-like chemotaxis protein